MCKIALGLGPLLLIWINLIPTWICNYTDYKRGIKCHIYSKLQRCSHWSLGMDTTLYLACVASSIVVPAIVIRRYGRLFKHKKSPRLFVNRCFRLCDKNLQRECLKIMKSQSYKQDQQNLLCNILWKMWPFIIVAGSVLSLLWRHNGHDGVSNHQPHDCLLNVYSDADQRKHQSSPSLAFVRGIRRGPVNSPHKWTVTRKMFPFDDVIMLLAGVTAMALPVHTTQVIRS